MRLVVFATLLALSVGSIVAQGKTDKKDKLILKDGQVVSGRIVSESENDIEILDGKEKIKVPIWAVDKVERNGVATPVGRAAASETGTRKQRFEKTPALSAWVDLCIKNLASPDPGVNASAFSALRTAGAAAMPALQKAANGPDKKLAERAKEVIASTKPPARAREARRGGISASEHRARTQALTEDLGLDAKQEPEVDKIFVEYREKTLELTQSVVDGKVTSDEAQKSVATLREQRNSKLSAILTEDQMKKYLASTERKATR